MILLPKNSWGVQTTKAKGHGVFTKKDIKKGVVVADYMGKLTHIVDVDLERDSEYIMYYADAFCLVPDRTRSGAHLLNHSCSPNCWIFSHEDKILFVSIRDIKKGEELTIHYLYPPLEEGCENCKHICVCGSKNCSGTMHTEEKLYKWWQECQRLFYEKKAI